MERLRVLKMFVKMKLETRSTNAITKVAKSSNSSNGATLYVTTSPCIECSKLIIQAGIRRVIFSEKYRRTDGLELLERAKIELVHLYVPSE